MFEAAQSDRNSDAVVTNVGVVGRVERADVAGDTGDQPAFGAEVRQQHLQRGGGRPNAWASDLEVAIVAGRLQWFDEMRPADTVLQAVLRRLLLRSERHFP